MFLDAGLCNFVTMAPSIATVLRLGAFLSTAGLVCGQSTTATSTTASELTATIAGQVVTYSPQFTVPAAADLGQTLLPNIQDPEAVDAQTVCPGYNASNVVRGQNGFSATLNLAGQPCKYVLLLLLTYPVLAAPGNRNLTYDSASTETTSRRLT